MHFRRHVSYRGRNHRGGKRLSSLENLEGRALLASDLGHLAVSDVKSSAMAKENAPAAAIEDMLATLKPTHRYEVDGQTITMVVHPNKVVLPIAEEQTRFAVASAGLELDRAIGSSHAVYSWNAEQPVNLGVLRADSGLQEFLPVFFLQESRTEAVLLDEVIVALKPGVTAKSFFGGQTTFASYEPLLGTSDQFVAKVVAGAGTPTLDVVNAFQHDERLAFIAPNFYQQRERYFIPNDPRLGNQWHLNNTGQGGGLVDADPDVVEAWDVIPGGSADYVIGIVDDGVQAHPDLTLWTNPGEIAGNNIDDDGNGWIDDVHGWNFVNNNNNSGPTTGDDSHGTSVAGVAAAKGKNGLGVAGASYNSQVISARIFDGNNVASDANIASALYYVGGRTANGVGTWDAADIVNNSWGGGGNSSAINAALTWGTTQGRMGLGTPYLFATGNDFGGVSQPAVQSLNIPGVFAIGATNNFGTRSDYSNSGPAVDLVAPSNDTRSGYLAIDTTDLIGADGYSADDYTGTGATGFGGTSSATPLATGITALTMARADQLGIVLTPAELRSYMRANSDLLGGASFDATTGKNNDFGFGRINANSAVTHLGTAEISVLSSTTDHDNGGLFTMPGQLLFEDFEQTFRIRNQGTLSLNLSSLSITPGPFSISSDLGDTILDIGEWTTFTVRFTPMTAGVHTGTVTINSNDLDESVFTLDLSGEGIQVAVTGVVFEDADADNHKDGFDAPLSGQIIYADVNNNQQQDLSPNVFANTTSIPLVDGGTASSTLTVSGLASAVFDVNVKLNITHTWDSDLTVTLISPSGTRVTLFRRVGGGGDNFTNTILDDDATSSIGAGLAPFTGTFRPQESLAAFQNQPGNGVWTLEVTDDVIDDTGNLVSWELTLSTSEPFAVTLPSGRYGIMELPVGSYPIRVTTPPGWASNIAYDIVVSGPADVFTGRDFGLGMHNRFYGLVFHDVNADGNWDPTESPAPGDRELLWDMNDNGILDSNATSTFTNATPLPLPDVRTTVSTISVTSLSGLVTDVNVRVNITMPFAADLDVFLISPQGTRVELFTDVGGGGQDFIDTVLDDQASTSIANGTAPFTGSFRPEGALAVLNSLEGNGTWTLEITDDAGGDTGTLNSWDLIITAGEVVTTVPATGLAKLDLPVGPLSLKLLPATDWEYTLPADGKRTVNVAGAPLQDQRYGTRRSNQPPTITVDQASVSAFEGGTLTNSGTWSDPNPADTVSFSASVGTVTFAASGTWSWSLAADDDTATTSVTITIDDGAGGTAFETFDYAVVNSAPDVTVDNAVVSGGLLTPLTNTGTWTDVVGDTVSLTATLGTVTKNVNGTWDWTYTPTSFTTGQTVTITASDEDGGSSTVDFDFRTRSTIANAQVYYRNSYYAAGGTNVPAALDPSKSLLRASDVSQAVSFANVTNFSKGINGIVFDIDQMPGTTLSGSDFSFRMSPQGDFDASAIPPKDWALAAAPVSITVLPDTPMANRSRIVIAWADNAIENRWLQVRLLATSNTGLAEPATYYLGHLRGDIDGVTIGGNFVVQNADLSAALPVGGLGNVGSPRDVDRNGFVLNADFVMIRSGINQNLLLPSITIPAQDAPETASLVPLVPATAAVAALQDGPSFASESPATQTKVATVLPPRRSLLAGSDPFPKRDPNANALSSGITTQLGEIAIRLRHKANATDAAFAQLSTDVWV